MAELNEYNKKRDFKNTPEPKGRKRAKSKELHFVVQKHAASRLHYDFRLELNGVLKSWAVPKGPSLNPSDKRLAMKVEDHPYDYKDFEGVIPEGNYGAGEVIIWDEGTYSAYETGGTDGDEAKLNKGLEKGDLKFVLNGKKLKGAYALVNMKKSDNSWLLIKKKDEYAAAKDITKEEKSVKSGLKVEQIKPGGDTAVWDSAKIKSTITDDELKDAVKKKMPSKIKPMLATLTKEPFDNDNWLFEIKWDGYRTVAEIRKGKVQLYSRNLKSFNTKFAPVAEALKIVDDDVILDGEVVVLDEKGRSSFQLLQNYQRTGKGNIIYYVFDILFLNGYDLTPLPLIKRKEILRKYITDMPQVKFSDHITGKGIDFFNLAQKNNLEGIIAKNGACPYLINKRSKDWLKIKTSLRQEAIICGYTAPKGSRKKFGALVLGVYEGSELVYIGHSGGGFSDEDLDEIYSKLNKLERKTSPFKNPPKTNTAVKWVTPKLVCEVSFAEWTEDGSMRHPVFLGLREDKKPEQVHLEKPAADQPETGESSSSKPAKRSADKKKEKEPAGLSAKEKKGEFIKIGKQYLKLTNLNKVYWPDEKYTKGDLIEYYDSIAEYMLPYLKERPESLNRHPNGINKKSFFQKDTGNMAPDWADTIKIYSESSDKEINYFVCNNKESLVYLANLGCIEINPWFSTVKHLENPDYCVIDLDPEDIPFDKVVETARAVKEVLDEAGAESYCKTSGSTGLHIYIPLNAKYDYDISKEFAHLIGRIVNGRIPAFTSLERSPSKRQKKVYLDYLQNRRGQTLAAPYSARPKPGATVAAPLHWDEVVKGLDPREFTIKTIHSRLEKIGDIFKPILGKGIDIEKSIKKLDNIK